MVNGELFSQQAYTKAANNTTYNYFGSTVSLDGEYLAVGANGDKSSQTYITNGIISSPLVNAYSSGAVFIYKRTGHSWAQQAYIKAGNS